MFIFYGTIRILCLHSTSPSIVAAQPLSAGQSDQSVLSGLSWLSCGLACNHSPKIIAVCLCQITQVHNLDATASLFADRTSMLGRKLVTWGSTKLCSKRTLCSSTATREEAEILQVICTVPGCIFEEMGTSSSAVIGPHCLNLISLCAIQSGASWLLELKNQMTTWKICVQKIWRTKSDRKFSFNQR